MDRAAITGVGTYVPSQVMTNDELATFLDTSSEWIISRTGIRERRIAADHETTSSMAVLAGRAALESAGLDPADVDLIVVATSTPDFIAMPNTASLVQRELGASSAGAFDVSAACSGFVYGIATADSFVRAGHARHVLLIGSETYSRILDWTDRTTCVLFGDGAGAVVLERTSGDDGIASVKLGADGAGAEMLIVPAGGSRRPTSRQTVDDRHHYVKMDGRGVFKFSTTILPEVARALLADVGLTTDDVALFIPHQANLRIVQLAAKSLGLPPERFFVNLEKYGNTSTASIPLALADAIDAGTVHDGDLNMLVGFGGGLTWGAVLVRWGKVVRPVRAESNGLLVATPGLSDVLTDGVSASPVLLNGLAH